MAKQNLPILFMVQNLAKAQEPDLGEPELIQWAATFLPSSRLPPAAVKSVKWPSFKGSTVNDGLGYHSLINHMPYCPRIKPT